MQKVLLLTQRKNYVGYVGLKDMVNSRNKGYRGEKLFRDKVLYHLGYKMRPPAVGSAGDDGKLGKYSCEVKNCKTIQFNKWIKQVTDNSDGDNWILAIKKQNSTEFTFTVSENVFFELLKHYKDEMGEL